MLFAVGLISVIKGGDWLVEAAVWFAKIIGIPQIIVGATIVSIGTTLPETMIAIFAAIAGSGDIVIGTSLGSILCNTGLVLGLNNLVRATRITQVDTLFKVGSMVGALVLLGLLGIDGRISGFDTFILLLLLVAYVASNIWTSANAHHHEKQPYTSNQLLSNVIHFIIGLVLVIIGARLILDSGVIIARNLGVSDAVIATTLFAIGSSLPELVTSVTAVLKGHNGLSFGNILGANTLNVLMVVGVSSAISPIFITREVLLTQIPVALLLMGLLVVPSFFTKQITRAQGLAAFLVYTGYILVLTIG